MSVFMTGAAGFIGRAVLARLVAADYHVVALAENTEEAAQITATGGDPFLGDEEDTRTLSALILDSIGVIHLATSRDRDQDFFEAVWPGLESSTKPFIYTGSLWTYGNNLDITENSPAHPPTIAAWLLANQQHLMKEDGVRTTIIVPGIVYGHGQGIPRTLIDTRGTSDGDAFLPLVGDGSQHWATVHVDDLADLYLRALEAEGHNNEIYIGTSQAQSTVAEIGQAAAQTAGLAGGAQPQSIDATRKQWGTGLADALLLDQHARADKAREQLGWRTERPTLIEELEAGYLTNPEDPLWT